MSGPRNLELLEREVGVKKMLVVKFFFFDVQFNTRPAEKRPSGLLPLAVQQYSNLHRSETLVYSSRLMINKTVG